MGKIKQFNQDSYIIKPMQKKGSYLLGVFDGHGTNGHVVSQYIKQHLSNLVQQFLIEDNSSLYEESKVQISIRQSLSRIQRGLKSDNIDTKFSGSTFNTVIIRGKHLTCANVGDSRAVLGKFHNN